MKQHKILLVDDEEKILKVLAQRLQNDKCEIISSVSAEEAMPIVEKQTIDLIICDYKLGGMNGIDFLEKVAKFKPAIITILLTGHADLNMALDAINRSVIYMFIQKPWDDKILTSSVEKALAQRDLATQNRLKMQEGLKEIIAEDVMSRFAITIKEDAPLLNAAHLMMRFKISGLPVMSVEGKVAGIITATDLFRMMGEVVVHEVIIKNSLYKGNIMVKDVMTKDVVSVTKDTTFIDIINTMYAENIHTLPVLDKEEMVGIIGRRDVINSFYNILKTTGE
ncbi:CBS domain-containing protein [Candidatus Omnitrophota bacterium]